MIVTLVDGSKVVTRKPLTRITKPIPNSQHHRHYLVITPVGRKAEQREVRVKDVYRIEPGVKIKP